MLTEQRFDIILKLLEERKSITVTELRELLDELEKAPNPFDFEDLVFLTDNTWSEVADVFIMLMQLIMQHESAEKVSDEINYKLHRQFDRISKENIPEWKEKMLNTFLGGR